MKGPTNRPPGRNVATRLRRLPVAWAIAAGLAVSAFVVLLSLDLWQGLPAAWMVASAVFAAASAAVGFGLAVLQLWDRWRDREARFVGDLSSPSVAFEFVEFAAANDGHLVRLGLTCTGVGACLCKDYFGIRHQLGGVQAVLWVFTQQPCLGAETYEEDQAALGACDGAHAFVLSNMQGEAAIVAEAAGKGTLDLQGRFVLRSRAPGFGGFWPPNVMQWELIGQPER